jgi:hypothetical protein
VRRLNLLRQPPALLAIWAALLALSGYAIVRGQYDIAFAGLGTFATTLLPVVSQRLLGVHIPSGFLVASVLFLIASLFLGEAVDFYERYWWWDLVLHIGSAIGFGLIGVILMLILVKGHRLTAAPVTVSFFAFCFAVTIGTAWEIWEFFLDQTFGLNTQKSGLDDTMWDLIVDCLGAAVGALAGYAYLKGMRGLVLVRTLHEFVRRNAHIFRRR